MSIDRFLSHAAETTVLVVGDVMVDAYLWGKVERISPEAPVPVVQVTRRSARLGGAANVALNLRSLGARAIVASVVGDDENAALLERLFAEQELPATALVRSAKRRTTVKTRVISGHQHVVRVDEEQEDDIDQDDERRLLDRITELVRDARPGVIVLEDYDKGVLSHGAIEGIMRLAQQANVPVAVDPKKRHFLSYRGATLFKPNLKELREGLKMDIDPTDLDSIREAVARLEQNLGNRLSMLTMSEHGAYIHGEGEEHHAKAHPRKIVDVSGAGDTVIAVAALALAQGLSPRDVVELSNLAGGLVCEEVGVVPVDQERFRRECERLGLPS